MGLWIKCYLLKLLYCLYLLLWLGLPLCWVTCVFLIIFFVFILCLVMFLSIYHSYHVQSMLFLWFLWASVRFCLPGFYCCHHQFITPSTFLQLVPLVSLPLPSSPAPCFSITAVITSYDLPVVTLEISDVLCMYFTPSLVSNPFMPLLRLLVLLQR